MSLLAEVSVHSAEWVDIFFGLAVIVALISFALCLMKLPVVTELIWVLLFAWAALVSAGLLCL